MTCSLYYLSFAEPDRFLGACVVEAPSFENAVWQASALGINPGGEVMGDAVPAGIYIPTSHRNRLLTRAEAVGLGKLSQE